MLIPRRCANPAVTQFAMPLPDGYTVEGDEHHANAVSAYSRQLFNRWQVMTVHTSVDALPFTIQIARLRVNYVWQLTDEDAITQGYGARRWLCRHWMGNAARAWVDRMAARGIVVLDFPRMATPTCSEWRALIVDFIRVSLGEQNDAKY